jgi:N-acyl homoserine lactone hydrolase
MSADLRLYCMSGGSLTYDQSIFTFMQGFGIPRDVPTPVYLIDHPKGKVLYETGLNPKLATDPNGHWSKEEVEERKPRVDPELTLDKQLATLGLTPKDIDYVVLSCLMYDHSGGMQLFPDSTFIVQHQEMQDAWWPDRRYMRSYKDVEFVPTRHYNFLELHGDDYDIFGDGSVEVLFCPSHTRGEQAMVVRLPNTGTVMMPAGCIPQRINLEENIMTGTPRAGPEATYASMERLRAIIRREDAMVLYHHDPEEWKTVKLAPEYYD